MYFLPEIITSKAELEAVNKDIMAFRAMKPFKELFRGQGRDIWRLEPSIIRKIKDTNEVKRIEKEIISRFHKKLKESNSLKNIQEGFLKGAFHSEWLMLMQAQHYGIPTRFMDWSARWDIALFFAVNNPRDDDFDGECWVFTASLEMIKYDDPVIPGYRDLDPYEFDETIFLNASGFLSEAYEATIAMRRKARQQGWFLIQPYSLLNTPLDQNTILRPYLYKIKIPKEHKENIRKEFDACDLNIEGLMYENRQEIDDIVEKLIAEYGL